MNDVRFAIPINDGDAVAVELEIQDLIEAFVHVAPGMQEKATERLDSLSASTKAAQANR